MEINNTLLATIIILLLAVLTLQVHSITQQDSFSPSTISTNHAYHSIDNPVLKQEQHALYGAVAQTEFNRGIHTWN